MNDNDTSDIKTSPVPSCEEQGLNKKPRIFRRKKLAVTLASILAVLVIAGGGFMVWHEQPSFCGAICHTPMDEYLANYMQDQGVVGTDKYGNEVSNTNAMMAVLHKKNNTTAKSEIRCLDCHEPTIAEQANEGINWVSGNYVDPLNEQTISHMANWRGLEGSQFCANQNCHSYLLGNDGLVDYGKLEQTTMDMEFNPHGQHHGIKFECGTCHKGHRASVFACTSCHEHENETLPEGWVSGAEGDRILSTGLITNA